MFGPRGTGKSLWLKRAFPQAIYLDFLSADVFRVYASFPERLEALIEGNPKEKTIHPQDLKGLLSFKEDYPQASVVLLYGGKERLKVQNVLCVPCEDFLINCNPRMRTLENKRFKSR